jgi:hypothetical protein
MRTTPQAMFELHNKVLWQRPEWQQTHQNFAGAA